MKPCCGDCRFFRITPDYSTFDEPRLDCHRYPPVAHPDPELRGFVQWPPVVSADWCGEHQPAAVTALAQIAEYRCEALRGELAFVESQLRCVPPDDPERAALALRRHEIKAQIAALMAGSTG